MTQEFKNRIVAAIKENRTQHNSAAKQAVTLDINSAQLSRIMNGDHESVLSDAKWYSIARRLDVQQNDENKYVIVKTPTYNFIYNQLSACQKLSMSGLLCDLPDIGKTTTAKCYVKENKYAIYIDCSQVKSKQKLTRQMAKEYGLGHTGKYADVYADLVFYLKSIPNPLIILDEFGDLDYSATLEQKALWNATEGCCGWYQMGAEGLKAKFESNLGRKKVGFAELFSRYGSRYQKATPDGKEALDDYLMSQVVMVAKANKPDVDVKAMIGKVNGSLRRVKIELNKLR